MYIGIDDRENFDRKVNKTNFNPNKYGSRIISLVPEKARLGFVPTSKTNKTPPFNARVIAAFRQIAEVKQAGEVSDTEADRQLTSLRTFAREVKSTCKIDAVVTEVKWHEVADNYQLYYSLLLEERARKAGIEIYQAKGQWIARKLLSNAFKNEFDNENKKKRKREEMERAENNLQVK